MYKLKVVDHFSSAHQLRGYQGKCEELHGHNWKVEAEVVGEKLDHVGLLFDFGELKKLLHEILARLDHRFLNDIEALQKINPSSELLARYIYAELQAKIPSQVSMVSVTVWESEKACAVYFE